MPGELCEITESAADCPVHGPWISKAEKLLLEKVYDWTDAYSVAGSELERTMVWDLIDRGLIEYRPNIDACMDIRATREPEECCGTCSPKELCVDFQQASNWDLR